MALLNVIYTAVEFLVCGSTIQALPVAATDIAWSVQQVAELKVFTKHLRKTYIYK